ncbi:MAG: tetratricopeptide repeat protein [Acidobacteria bacterium]|nr:tetratricopeptide repeat protein [Acidobacteriota bacterium]
MMLARFLRPAAVLLFALAIPAAAKDVYRAFLDPGIPQHKATLDILARLEATPNDASLHNDLGCLIARDGFWRDALREFETAQKLDKKDGRAPYNAGLVQTTRGEWGSARSSFKTAVDRDPGNWPAWWMLGFSEEKLGNAGAATQAYARSLRVDTSLFDVKRNPYALQSRLKSRVLLETFDARFARAALPSTEQLAHPDVLTSFQSGRVAVTAAPGPVVAEEAHGRTAVPAGPGGGPATVAAPAGGGAVVTSVPPVSSSRPAAPAAPLVSAPAAPARSSGLEEAPPWFPQTSPAGPAPAKTPRPASNPDPGGTTTPAPPPPPGPGVG